MTISEISKKLKAGELNQPNELATYLVLLSANLTSAEIAIIDAKQAYAKQWLDIKSTARPNGKERSNEETEMITTTTDAYREWKVAEASQKTMQEVINALKFRLKVLEMEAKNIF